MSKVNTSQRFAGVRSLALFAVLAVGCATTSAPSEPAHHKVGLKGHTHDTDLLALVLNATPIGNIADNAASSPIANVYLAFHTADPGVGGDQTTSEATFTGYTRTAIGRSNVSQQWTITSPSNVGTAKNTNPITGPTYTAGAGSPQTLTSFSLGVASSGPSKTLYEGALTSSLVMNPGETINIAANALVVTEQ